MEDCRPSDDDCGSDRVRLRLLATSDVHGHLRAHDYYTDRPDPDRGLSLAATLAERLRDEAEISLLLDNGDFLQGTPLTDLAAQEACEGETHPVIGSMNEMGYDAAALGNHEFDYGLPYLDAALAEARFPVLCANVLRDGSEQTLAAPWTVLERQVPQSGGTTRPLRIGVLGLAPPQIARWSQRTFSEPIRTRPIRDTAQALLPELRNAGADLVIVLCHSGIGTGEENAALEVARLPGVDAMIVGHTHLVFPDGRAEGDGIDAGAGTLHGVPAVQPGANGSHLGVIDLRLEAQRGGDWSVAAREVRVLPVSQAGTVESPSVLRATARTHARTCETTRRPLGETCVPLQSYFAQLGPCAPVQLLAEAKRAHARARLPDALREVPMLAAVAPARTGGRGGPRNYIDIPEGPLLARHAAELYPYPNRVCAVEVTGAEVRDWLERAAAQFRQIVPGERGQSLIDPAVPGFSVDTLEGLSYEIDVSRPARFAADGTLVDGGHGRIRDLGHGGEPVRDCDRFIVVTNSFRLGGGGSVPAVTGKADLIDGASTRSAVEDYLRESGPIAPAPGPGWRLAPLEAPTEIHFHTGPGARAHLGEAPLPLRPEGVGPDGFLRLSLTL